MLPRTTARLAQLLNSSCTIYNLYGPAETTIASSYYQVTEKDFSSDKSIIPIGRPLPNYQIFVLDSYYQSVPIGEIGEICIGGVGVFDGYLYRNDSTEKHLIHLSNSRIYRTGDLGKLTSDGQLLFVGRVDFQIKIRGQRVEIGEIEHAILASSSNISNCVVMKRTDNQEQDYIVAYVESSNVTESTIVSYCNNHLPSHMVPSAWRIMSQLPTNSNGKIDRKALPLVERIRPIEKISDIGGHEPITATEERLQCIFAEALHIPKHEDVGVTVSLANLGGSSLSAIKIVTLIREQMDPNIDIAFLFKYQSIRDLAPHIKSSQKNKYTSENNVSFTEACKNPKSLLISETLGVVLILVLHYMLPILISFKLFEGDVGHVSAWLFHLTFISIFQLTLYIFWSNALTSKTNFESQTDDIFSFNYYCRWFLQRLWTLNSPQLACLIGTPFYNQYLRLCGAQIGHCVHINTCSFTAPDLLIVGDESWIGYNVIINCMSYSVHHYTLHRIKIGNSCIIDTGSVIYEQCVLGDNVHVKMMSSVCGIIASDSIIDGYDVLLNSNNKKSSKNSLPLNTYQCLFQLMGIGLIIFIYSLIFSFLCAILPLTYIGLTIISILGSILIILVTLGLLMFIIGPVDLREPYCSVNSWYYLQKIWLRYLVGNTLGTISLRLLGVYSSWYSVMLRLLGAQVGYDVKIADIEWYFKIPTDLVTIESHVSTHNKCVFTPVCLTNDGKYHFRKIIVRKGVTFANNTLVSGGVNVPSDTMVGSMTRLELNDMNKFDDGNIILGVPPHKMPFEQNRYPYHHHQREQKINHFLKYGFESLRTFTAQLITKFILVACFLWPLLNLNNGQQHFIYVFMSTVSCGMILHTFIFCLTYRLCNMDIRLAGEFSFDKTNSFRHIISMFIYLDYTMLTGRFIGATQFLSFVFRGLGARIGRDVIIADLSCLNDYQFISVRDRVRIDIGALVQVCITRFMFREFSPYLRDSI